MAQTKTPIKISVRIPRIILDVRGVDPELIESIKPGLEHLDARIRLYGEGNTDLPHAYSMEEAIEEADIWVFFNTKLPKDFKTIVGTGIVPVLMEGSHKSAENYSPTEEKGNAFIFHKLNPWNIYGSLVRAIENFAFVYDWRNLKAQAKTLV